MAEDLLPTRHFLMTGITGFLAPFVATRFLRRGYRLLFLMRKRSMQESDLRQLILKRLKIADPGYRDEWSQQWGIIIGDITLPRYGIPEHDFYQLREKITDLFHAAALLSFKEKYRERARTVNVDGVRHTLEVAEYLSARLYYVSTAYVAGERKGIVRETEFDEGQSFNNIYEETKFEGERLVRAWMSRSGNRAVIYRPSIIVGDAKTGVAFSFSGYYVMAKFVRNSFRWLEHSVWTRWIMLPIPIVRNATLNLIPVNDVSTLIDEITSREQSLGKTFHLVNPHPPSVRFVFGKSLKLLGIPRVYLISVPEFVLQLSARIARLVSYLFGKHGKIFRGQVLMFVPYFKGGASFCVDNVEQLLGRELTLTAVDESYLQKILEYGISHQFTDLAQS